MKKLIYPAILLLIGLAGFADTIFSSKPDLRQWDPKYTFVQFADHFNGDSLDRSKWIIESCQGRGGLPGHSILTSNKGEPGNIQVSNGTLKLIARHEPGNLNNDCWTGPFISDYTTVEIYTKRPEFSYRYGIFEARCKMPRGLGLFPAYWLWGPGTDVNSRPRDGVSSEIDIAEGIQRTRVDKFIHAFHFWLKEPGTQASINDGELNFGTSFLGEWHVYKIIWTPYEVLFFVDDTLTWGRTKYYRGLSDGWRNDVFSEEIQSGKKYKVHEWFPRHICETRLQMQLNGDIKGRETALLPALFEVDYVKVSQFFEAPEIIAPPLVNKDEWIKLDADPELKNISWRLYPGDLFSGATAGNGTSAPISPSTFQSGVGKIVFYFDGPSGESFSTEKKLFVIQP